MKKSTVKHLAGALVTILLFVGIMSYMMQLVSRKDSYHKYQPFYDSQLNIDVLFLGSSHVRYSVYPVELLQDYGITAYNFGGHSNRMATSYWMMVNAFDYTNPKLVVIDCFMLSENTKFREDNNGYSYLHDAVDHIPFSVNKVKMIWDLLESSNRKWEYLWSFSQFHNRWNQLEQNDFEPTVTATEGASFYYEVYTPHDLDVVTERKGIQNTVSVDYLCRIIEECQKQDIEVLLTYLPFPATEKYWDEAYTAGKIAEKYGVPYINYLEEDVVDYATDCKDNNHLNYSGGQKITKHLGTYIAEHYHLPDRRKEADEDVLAAKYQAYMDYKRDMLQAQDELECYLVGLSDDRFSFVLEVEDSAYIKKTKYKMLLQNLGIDQDAIAEEGATIVCVSGETQEAVYYYGALNEKMRRKLDISDIEQKEKENLLIRFTVTDNQSGERIDEVSFVKCGTVEANRIE